MPFTSRQVYLKSTPVGMPTDDDFEVREETIDDPSDGEVVVRNAYMSVDPYMRGQMRMNWKPGTALVGGAVGEVVASKNPDFPEGSHVNSNWGWREYYNSDGRGLAPVDASLAPLSTYLGIMGMPGLTAWGGLLITGEYKDGESVFVSAASGAVGSVVGQIAKIKGGTVVGSAGSDEKVAHLVNEFGFDHAFNYKTANPLDELQKGAPDGIDVYFENVGGEQLEAALTHMRPYGRIPICGMIAHYNDSDNPTPGPRNLTETIYKFVQLRGFVVSAFNSQQAEFRQEMGGWIRDGRIRYQETTFDGINKASAAFRGLFTGVNEGKMLVKLA